ncbi:MAG: hypothetical protein ACP5RT_00030 [Candidatus Micrarchaeia archaeon]
MEDSRDLYQGMVNKENAKLFEKERKVDIKDLLEGKVPLGSIIEIEDYVYRIFNPKKFEKEGKERILRSMILGDIERSIRVTLWNKSSFLVDSIPIERGDKIFASNLLLRKGLTDFELSSTQNTFFNKIAQSNIDLVEFSLLKEGKNIDIYGKITEIGSPKYFKDQNGKDRKVVRCVITDGITSVNAVFWDSSCDYVMTLHPGDFIKIEFASVKNDNKSIEVNANNFSRIASDRYFKNKLNRKYKG